MPRGKEGKAQWTHGQVPRVQKRSLPGGCPALSFTTPSTSTSCCCCGCALAVCGTVVSCSRRSPPPPASESVAHAAEEKPASRCRPALVTLLPGSPANRRRGMEEWRRRRSVVSCECRGGRKGRHSGLMVKCQGCRRGACQAAAPRFLSQRQAQAQASGGAFKKVYILPPAIENKSKHRTCRRCSHHCCTQYHFKSAIAKKHWLKMPCQKHK